MAGVAENEPIVYKSSISDEPEEVRSGFIQKVYSVLTIQLLVTGLIASPFVLHAPTRAAVRTPAGMMFYMFLIAANLTIMLAMVCPCCGCKKYMRIYPQNYMMLFAFTATEGCIVGVICSMYTVNSVLFAVFATAVLVGGLTGYAMYTKSDFTGMGAYLFAAGLVLMIFSWMLFFFYSPIMHKIICCFGILLFSMYLIYDTQMIMGNKEYAIGIDDYAYACLMLYVDIIQLFLYILQLFGDRD